MPSSGARSDRTLWIFLGVVAFSLAMYVVPYGHYVAYPLVLLSTFAHEMGHGVTAILAGGEFVSFEMYADGSGVAHLELPPGRLAHAATSAGGLVGPAVLAAILFWLAKRPRKAHVGLVALGVLCLVALVLVVRSLFGFLVVSLLGVTCAFLGVRASARVAQVSLALMAVQLSLSVFSRADYLFTESAGAGPSDVAQMADALLLPYWFWGFVCGAFSVFILVVGIRAFLGARVSA